MRGMPFVFGAAERPNVILLDAEDVSVELDDVLARYFVFIHVVEEAADMSQVRAVHQEGHGYKLGDSVSEYALVYADGSSASTPILRRFAIQQARCSWGSVPFACVPAAEDRAGPVMDEMIASGAVVDPAWALNPTRVAASSLLSMLGPDSGLLWVYALVNPKPEMPVRSVLLRPRGERSAVYALSFTDVVDHPLRPGVRRKLRLRLPDGLSLNGSGELDAEAIGVDLGVVISARAALDYDADRWLGPDGVVKPQRSDRDVIVEYAAHSQARLFLGNEVHEVASTGPAIRVVPPADRRVHLRFLDAETRSRIPVRLHMHGEAGEYLPPRGHHRKVTRQVYDDHYAEFVNGDNQYAYVDGECVADLPLGTVYVEITRGYEIAPVRTSVHVEPDTAELVFELERVLRWRERGWVTADTHVHFLSPQTALLEGRAEDVNVVNLLASQWGELFSNVGDFDGTTTFGGTGPDGSGEFLVRVGSENRMHVLGHISLLGYKGPLIHPLCTGGPDESALGDPLEVTMAEWAQRCLDQGGLVVMPHAPTPQLERAADMVLGLVNAVELMNYNPLEPGTSWRTDWRGVADAAPAPALSGYGLADWYRYLNLGYHVPLVGGSDKMSAEGLLGGIRTYAQLGERELSYENWMEAIRAGNTFVTIGPLVELAVEGVAPGGRLRLPAGGGTVQVEWRVESLRLPVDAVEIVVGGLTESRDELGGTFEASGRAALRIGSSTWIAVRVRGTYHQNRDDIAAHTSVVQVIVDGSELFSEADSVAVLDQIQGAIAYVDTVAPRADVRRFRELRATLEVAYNRLHQRMHAAGLYHRHPLHDPAEPHEH